MKQPDLDIVNKIVRDNGGIDPITAARTRIEAMSREDLENVVFIAANRIGLQLNNNQDYTDPIEALNFIILGMREILGAYDNARNLIDMNKLETTGVTWGVHSEISH